MKGGIIFVEGGRFKIDKHDFTVIKELRVNKFLVRHKKFGPAQYILRPVKGQGITQ